MPSTFQSRVCDVVKAIPRGSVKTYGDVAREAGFPGAARAVGSLMRKNFDPEIPCHRVVGAHDLGEYNRGKERKREILQAEGVDVERYFA